jgi:hypothetical protein
MAIPEAVAFAVGAVKAAEATIDEVGKALDAFARSVIIEVVNTTDETLRVEGATHSSGGFAKPPPPTIPPRQSVIFTSRTTTALRGAVGNLRLVGDDYWLGMSWHNPVSGSNKFRSSVNGRRASEFLVYAIAGSGNKNAYFPYYVSYSDLGRVQQMYQPAPSQKKPIKAVGRPRPKKTVQDLNESAKTIKAQPHFRLDRGK